MTVSDVRERVRKIEAIKDNPEEARWEEYVLWEEVLEAIACGDGDSPVDLAWAALASRYISFVRWCA